MMTGPMGPYELVHNVDYGSHEQALSWLAEHYSPPCMWPLATSAWRAWTL